MRTGTLSALAAAALAATAASAAPDAREAVAPGFVDWTNVTDKNLLAGLPLTPSDLRQRTVVYVVVDDAWLTTEKISDFAWLSGLMPNQSETFAWDTTDIEIRQMIVVSVRNSKASKATFAERLRPPKGGDKVVEGRLRMVKGAMLPFYKDVAPADEAEMAADRLPFVAVYAADSAEPVFKAEKYDLKNFTDVRKAVSEAKKRLPADWTPPLGVREPQHCKSTAALFAKGKPAKDLLASLKSSLKSKDPEVSKEAQTVYDAINQYGTTLRYRIVKEAPSAPARAYYDLQLLLKNFPAEKKKLAEVDAKLKKIPEAGSLGKIFEKLLLWGRDDFAPKSAGEARKIVAELQKIKKTLAVLSESSNAHIQGEAMLFASKLDTMIDTIQAKVPQQ